jgi:hypothetical protein
LFFEENINRFTKEYDKKKASLNYKKYCEEDGSNLFNNKAFG